MRRREVIDDTMGDDAVGDRVPWFGAEGLAFTCKWPACVACCTGEGGFVWLDDAETAALAGKLGLAVDAFMRDFTVRIDGRVSLIEAAGGDCILLGERGCTVYDARPGQCRAYPFWPEIVATPGDWEHETAYCPGINAGGAARHDAAAIAARLRLKHTSQSAERNREEFAAARRRILADAGLEGPAGADGGAEFPTT
jgi:Fe-S-cluster containining protein